MLHRPSHTIGPHEVHVWHLLADQLTDPAALHAIYALLSPQEQERMTCLRRTRDQTLFVLARGLMRTVLASYLDCKCHEVRFAANDYGKPILHADARHPPLQFNLTHSRGAAALAVSRDREVGIDVEERQRPVEYLALAQRFFAATEARHLQELREEQRGDAFFAIWTLKEAFVKGIGRGLSFPLDAFCFDLEVNRLIRFRPLADFVSCDWQFHQFNLGERHCGALAVQNPAGSELTIELRYWPTAFIANNGEHGEHGGNSE
jgi:4'-phosphopantetheinyl transferase